jgi:hypothetical protein
LNGIHQLLVYADCVNLVGENINTKQKSRENLLDAMKGDGTEINVEQTVCTIYSCHSHGPRRLRRVWSSITRTVGSWVGILLDEWAYIRAISVFFSFLLGTGLVIDRFPVQDILPKRLKAFTS